MMKKLFTLILIGGCCLNIQNTLAQNLAAMPTPRYGTCAVVFNDEVYVIGGRDAPGNITDLVQVYNPATNTWRTEKEELKEKRENAAALIFMNTIYVLGGRSDEDKIENEVEFFNTIEEKWEDIEEMEFHRDGLSAVVLNNKLYAVGGFGGEDDDEGTPARFLNSTEYYDPLLKKWLPDDDWQMNLPRASFAAVIFDESAFVIGGFSNLGPLAKVESYNPGNGLLDQPNLKIARGGFAAVVAQNHIFVLGGRNRNDEVLASIEYFDLAQNAWQLTGLLNTPRELFSTVTYQDTIYVFGGLNDDGDVIESIEKIAPDNITSVSENRRPLPSGFLLRQNYPNPFNPQTKISFQIPGDGFSEVKLNIYSITGQFIKRLVKGNLAPGQHSVTWDGRNSAGNAVASGLYLYSLQYDKIKQTRKMLLVR